MTQTAKTGNLSTLGAGSKFTYGGIEWIVLEQRQRAGRCIAADIVEKRAFDEGNKNDFAASSVRAYLNGDFMKKMVEAGADKDSFLYIKVDLTSEDGLKDYGTDSAQIALISCEVYRHFRSLIPNASDWWWTCTPYSTASNGYSYNVRYVDTDGTLVNDRAYNGSYGLRPLCYLKSDIVVSFNEADVKERTVSPIETLMKGFTDALGFGGGADTFTQKPEEPDEDEGCDFGELAGNLFNMYSSFQTVGFTEAQAWELTMRFVPSFQGGDDK